MTRDLRNIAASVYTRLRTRARERGEGVPLVHQRYAAERLLYRVAQSPYHDQFVLRGGMLYEIWGGSVYRPTSDLDLLGYGSPEPERIRACFRELAAIEVPDDGLRFASDSIRVRKMREEAEYSGVEVRLELHLHTARIPLKVDVGFGDAVVPGVEEVEYPPLLDGPAPYIRIYPRESVIAEKLHAAALFAESNTRMKDFYDLFVLSQGFSFEGATLARAIAATFERRRTPLPPALPIPATFFGNAPRAERWRGYLKKNELSAAPGDFIAIGGALREFLGPPYDALVTESDYRASWEPGGPWR